VYVGMVASPIWTIHIRRTLPHSDGHWILGGFLIDWIPWKDWPRSWYLGSPDYPFDINRDWDNATFPFLVPVFENIVHI
jgi:hypothetical protein